MMVADGDRVLREHIARAVAAHCPPLTVADIVGVYAIDWAFAVGCPRSRALTADTLGDAVVVGFWRLGRGAPEAMATAGFVAHAASAGGAAERPVLDLVAVHAWLRGAYRSAVARLPWAIARLKAEAGTPPLGRVDTLAVHLTRSLLHRCRPLGGLGAMRTAVQRAAARAEVPWRDIRDEDLHAAQVELQTYLWRGRLDVVFMGRDGRLRPNVQRLASAFEEFVAVAGPMADLSLDAPARHGGERERGDDLEVGGCADPVTAAVARHELATAIAQVRAEATRWPPAQAAAADYLLTDAAADAGLGHPASRVAVASRHRVTPRQLRGAESVARARIQTRLQAFRAP